MNPIVFLMLLFAGIGFLDKMFDFHLGLADAFDRGLAVMGPMSLSIVGICSVLVTLIQNHLNRILSAISFLPFDSSLLIGAVLAPDMGGFSISSQLASDPSILILNGVVLSSILGQTLSFQFPVFLSSLKKEEHPFMMKGFLIGIGAVPAGFFVAGLLLPIKKELFLQELIPILCICLLILTALLLLPRAAIRIFSLFAKIIQWITYSLFFLAVAGLFFPTIALTDLSTLKDASFIVFQSAIIVSGSLVLSEVIVRYLKHPLNKLGALFGINQISVIGLILNCATSLAILPLFPKMDQKGKLFNTAFAVSGAYFAGGQLGYISSVTDSKTVTVYLISKIICGLVSLFIAELLCRRGFLNQKNYNISEVSQYETRG